ncbi:chromatin structure-remodeling complex protein SYD isoform X3 [Rhodamnia argentea]|uniref:Chromatin structure-remodeling complex protein SYD isoform X3 n=1 Tax=Rhodamnia argentea TaxID=178133 RepID=A0ABM3H646_9MYRT|nr:chromatin structure-remodeling complex protein SYD isoform X3 [Rhodamnia argentea]
MAAPSSSHHVELEAAKFLQKLIQESKDEPAKLATKLFVILQHMKSSGKEHSMPYQVISRAMETVINQHGLDIEALKSSRLPLSGGSQTGEAAAPTHAGSSQAALPTTAGLAENEMSKSDPFSSNRQPVGPNVGPVYFHESAAHRSGHSLENEGLSSFDPRSAGLQSQERHDQASWGRQPEGRKLDTKRKRGDSSGAESNAENFQKVDSSNSLVHQRKGKMNKVEPLGSSIVGVSRSRLEDQMQAGGSSHGFAHKMHGERSMEVLPVASSTEIEQSMSKSASQFISSARRDDVSTAVGSGSLLEHDRGKSSFLDHARRNIQDPGQNSVSEAMLPRSSTFKETGKRLSVPGMLFKEQQLKQLRAQCLVFLAFRNGMAPKPLHLDIALGNMYQKEGGSMDGHRPELVASKEVAQLSNEPSKVPNLANPLGRLNKVGETERNYPASAAGNLLGSNFSKEANQPKLLEISGKSSLDHNAHEEERRRLIANKNLESEMQNQSDSQFRGDTRQPIVSSAMELGVGGQVGNVEKDRRAFIDEHHNGILMDAENGMPRSVSREVPAVGAEEEEEDNSPSCGLPPPKHTMLEKWIMHQQRIKFSDEQNWSQKRQKARQRIATSFERLKKSVSSSEDLSTKTKSVIELKKLQLLALQHRLRSDFMNDFFKPVVAEMDHLRLFKKHKHGRRTRQIERYEQKMKEERQKRIRERQKEFFGDLEVHKERLDDVFKIKRERLRGFNKYVKEFHKRKERIHREKNDRIQREKLTLLKINDVEGYLRMVQDTKSDRVKQLLKETEKYLQKLGSKLQEAKAVAKRCDNDIDEEQSLNVLDKSESIFENEDDCDQAKHYKESNEKYYMMAHSIKESIAEQPTTLKGGKLREYQLNGLRWLVSLYNNHLNGILADEMGLGKTVQVISLICYLMEAKNDQGPFLVVVPSSVLPGWESEIKFWAPGVLQIVYAGSPEERRRLFKEKIVHQKFNVLLTTYEYLMNKHDRPKLCKIHWRYLIIDEGHRIKNASCKLNAELKHYQSSHRLLLTGTPLQNNLEELWALLNFLLPNIFNSSEDFSQWFNKPFESNGDNSPDEALLSEEENLLIINRLHQVLRPFVLRRLKHKVENQLPEKIERLIRCEASAYQKLLMKRVEQNLGSLGNFKARAVQNSVIELRNICNHPYISQLHADEVDSLIPRHYLPPIIRLCGKLEMLDRLLPKLKATDHRVLFFSTMTRLLDVMEEYLGMKQYRYLRLDGHTSGGDRGALIDLFNKPNSPFFIFLLSIRAGGVGVNLQAADTVIIFDTDWNPQVDLQAQARAHRIGQKKDVLVLRFETVQTVEEQVRKSAEHKLGVANQSITAGFFDNDTSPEDRREYLESLLRECKKEEAAPVLDDDRLNDILARSEPEIDVFESIDKQRHEEEMATWAKLVHGREKDDSKPLPPLPPRLLTDDELKEFYEAMKVYEVSNSGMTSTNGVKRKSGYAGSLDTEQYGRGKRAREVRSYEEQMTEEEFEKMCQVESPGSPKLKDEDVKTNLPVEPKGQAVVTQPSAPLPLPVAPLPLPASSPSIQPSPVSAKNEVTPPAKRGRGRPKRVVAHSSPTVPVVIAPTEAVKLHGDSQGVLSTHPASSGLEQSQVSTPLKTDVMVMPQSAGGFTPTSQASPFPPTVGPQTTPGSHSVPPEAKEPGRKAPGRAEAPRGRGRKRAVVGHAASDHLPILDPTTKEQFPSKSADSTMIKTITPSEGASISPATQGPQSTSAALVGVDSSGTSIPVVGSALNSMQPSGPSPLSSTVVGSPLMSSSPSTVLEIRGDSQKSQSGGEAPRRGRRRKTPTSHTLSDGPIGQDVKLNSKADQTGKLSVNEMNKLEVFSIEIGNVGTARAGELCTPTGGSVLDTKNSDSVQSKQSVGSSAAQGGGHDVSSSLGQIQSATSADVASASSKSGGPPGSAGGSPLPFPVLTSTLLEGAHVALSTSKSAASISLDCSTPSESSSRAVYSQDGKNAHGFVSASTCPPGSVQVTRQTRKNQGRAETPRRRGRRPASVLTQVPDVSSGKQDVDGQQLIDVTKDPKSTCPTDSPSKFKSPANSTGGQDTSSRPQSLNFGQKNNADVRYVATMMKEILSENRLSKTKIGERLHGESLCTSILQSSGDASVEVNKEQSVMNSTFSGRSIAEMDTPGVDLQTQSNQHEFEGSGAVEEKKLPIVSKLVVCALESKVATGSLGTFVKGQVTSESLDEMPAVPPGFEKFDISASKMKIGGQSEVVYALPSVASETSREVTVNRTSEYAKESAISSKKVATDSDKNSSMRDDSVSNEAHDSSSCIREPPSLTTVGSAETGTGLTLPDGEYFVKDVATEVIHADLNLVEEDNVKQCASDDENKLKTIEKTPADAVESTENFCQRQAACGSDNENKFKSMEKAPADAIESTENFSRRQSASVDGHASCMGVPLASLGKAGLTVTGVNSFGSEADISCRDSGKSSFIDVASSIGPSSETTIGSDSGGCEVETAILESQGHSAVPDPTALQESDAERKTELPSEEHLNSPHGSSLDGFGRSTKIDAVSDYHEVVRSSLSEHSVQLVPPETYLVGDGRINDSQAVRASSGNISESALPSLSLMTEEGQSVNACEKVHVGGSEATQDKETAVCDAVPQVSEIVSGSVPKNMDLMLALAMKGDKTEAPSENVPMTSGVALLEAKVDEAQTSDRMEVSENADRVLGNLSRNADLPLTTNGENSESSIPMDIDIGSSVVKIQREGEENGAVDRTNLPVVNGALPTCILEETHPSSNICAGEGPIGGSNVMSSADFVETLGGEKLEAEADASLELGNGSENRLGDACLPSSSMVIHEGKSDNSPVKEINDGEIASQGSEIVPELASRSMESSQVNQLEPRLVSEKHIASPVTNIELSEMKPGVQETDIGAGKDNSQFAEVLPEDASDRNEPLPMQRTSMEKIQDDYEEEADEICDGIDAPHVDGNVPVNLHEGKSDNSPVKCPVESSASFEKVQGPIEEINDGENASQGSEIVPDLASGDKESSQVNQLEPGVVSERLVFSPATYVELSEIKPGGHETDIGDGNDTSHIAEVLPEDASDRNEPLPMQRTSVEKIRDDYEEKSDEICDGTGAPCVDGNEPVNLPQRMECSQEELVEDSSKKRADEYEIVDVRDPSRLGVVPDDGSNVDPTDVATERTSGRSEPLSTQIIGTENVQDSFEQKPGHGTSTDDGIDNTPVGAVVHENPLETMDPPQVVELENAFDKNEPLSFQLTEEETVQPSFEEKPAEHETAICEGMDAAKLGGSVREYPSESMDVDPVDTSERDGPLSYSLEGKANEIVQGDGGIALLIEEGPENISESKDPSQVPAVTLEDVLEENSSLSLPTEDEKVEISSERKEERRDTEFGNEIDASPVGGAGLEMVPSVDESQSASIVPEDVCTIDQCSRQVKNEEKVEDPAEVRLDTEVGDGKHTSPMGAAVLEEVPSVDESQPASIEPEDVSTIDQSFLQGKNQEKVEDPAEVRLDTEGGDGKDAFLVGGAVLEEEASVDESQPASIEPEDVSTIDQPSHLGKNQEKVEDLAEVRLDTEVGNGKDASPVGGAVLEEVPSVDESQPASIEPEDVSTIDQSSLQGKNQDKVEDPAEVRLDTEVGNEKDASSVGGAVLEEVPSVDESQSASMEPEDVSIIDQSSFQGKNQEKVEDPAEVRLDTEVGDGKDALSVGAAVLEEVPNVVESQSASVAPEDVSTIDQSLLGKNEENLEDPSEVRMEMCGADDGGDPTQLTGVALANVQTGGQSQVAASLPETKNASFQVDGEEKVEDSSLEKMEAHEDILGDGIDAGGNAPGSASERLGHFQDVGTLTEDSSEKNPPPSSADANDESVEKVAEEIPVSDDTEGSRSELDT